MTPAVPAPASPGPHVRLAIAWEMTARPFLMDDDGLSPVDRQGVRRPSILISYAFEKMWRKLRPRLAYGSWAIDSGAHTVWSAGGTVDHGAFLAFCQEMNESPFPPDDIFALDEIPKGPNAATAWRTTLANSEEAWRRGVKVIPTWHVGEPEDYLRVIARDYPKIAIAGAGRRRDVTWKLGLCQAAVGRVWPKRVHLLGLISERVLTAIPAESCDSSYWAKGPFMYGQWRVIQEMNGGGKLLAEKTARARRVPQRGPIGATSNKLLEWLAAEIAWYVRLEDKLRAKWGAELAKLQEAT